MSTTGLMNATQLGEKHGVSNKTITAILDKAKTPIVYEIPSGRGLLRLYEPAVASPVIEAYLAAKAPKKPVQPAPPVAQAATSTLDLAPLQLALNRALDRLDMVDGQNETLLRQVAQLHAQNVVLLKAVEKVGLDANNRLDALQCAIDQMRPPAPVPLRAVEALAPPPAPMPKPPKPKVCIVGLLPAQTQLIETDFREVFDLRFIDITELRGGKRPATTFANVDAVLVMTKFVNHTAEDLKANAKRLVRVNGGITALKDALTSLYLELCEKKVAA